MKKIISKNTKKMLSAGALLLILFAFVQQSVFAGNQPTATVESTGSIKTLRPAMSDERHLAAAQISNERRMSNGGGSLQSGDSAAHRQYSFFSAVALLIFGILTLFVLLRNRLGKKIGRNRRRFKQFRIPAMSSSFALAVFGFSFAAVIIGGQLTAPATVSAEKLDKNNRNQLVSPASVTNKAVFKSAQQIGNGDGITQIGTPVFDQQGNRYVRGGFSRTLTIGSTTLTASRDFDLFVAKYDANGNALWARQGSGANTAIPNMLANEGATVLAVDAGNNVYVGGSFVKTITLQGGANANQTLTDAGGSGINYESFIAKYNANGDLLWARGGDSGSSQNTDNLETGQNAIDQIVIGADGNLYVTGLVSGSRFFGETFAGGGQSDILLTKLDATNGAIVWKQIIGGTDDDNGLDLKIDGTGNLYLIGNFASPMITFPNGATFSNPDTDPEYDNSVNTFIAKFDTGGANLWVKNLDNAETLSGAQIAVNPAGEVFLTGYFFDTVTFDSIVLTENEGSGEDEASFGGYLAMMDADGDFIWAKSFGGLGEGIALDGTGRIYVVGTFWNSGVFGAGEPNQELLASFGGEDLFVARFATDGNLDWAKPIAASGINGQIIVGDPSDINNKTENSYTPLGISYNAMRDTMFISGDFEGAVTLDCQTLNAQGIGTQSYIAELSADGESTTCRIWNGLDPNVNDWDSTANWNGGIVPQDYDSVYIPYTGNSFDNPNYNPAGIGVILVNLTVADERTLTFYRDLPMTGDLWLTGGIVDTRDRLLDLTDTATANHVADADGNGGYVIGKLRKDFGSSLAPFIFPVGTANGYSPVDVFPQFGFGALLSVKAVEQPQPLFANSENRINRYWELTRAGKGFLEANLKFHYLQTDVIGDESQFRLFKVEENSPFEQTATIDTMANTATVNDVSEFSDWTLAELAPTAARIPLNGRILSANGNGIARVLVTLTDSNGITKSALTNSFGKYTFPEMAVGETYVLNVAHKKYRFSPSSQVVYLNDESNEFNFVASN